MAFIIVNCVRCSANTVQHQVEGSVATSSNGYDWEIAVSCQACNRLSIYNCRLQVSGHRPEEYQRQNLADVGKVRDSIKLGLVEPKISPSVPQRIANLFQEAGVCRQIQRFEAAGAMYRKTLDVATKYIYQHDSKLVGKEPAQALRVRIKSLGEMGVLEADIVELADVAALDGNDAAHDIDPYTAEEAEALEDLTIDLLDRLFVRPARLAAVKAKQIASGQRKAD